MVAATDFDRLIPGFAELRAQERQHRAIAFAGLTTTVCGCEIMPLTPMHRLELQLLKNAFTMLGSEPLHGDVFQFLWLLSAGRGPRSSRPTFRLRFKQWTMRARVRRLDLMTATQEIYRYLIVQLQDSPESGGAAGTDFTPWVHWIAEDASWWLNIHGGFTLQTFLETPYVVLQQLYRAYRCHHPSVSYGSDGRPTAQDPQFINRSDQLINAWQRQHRFEFADFVRSQRERKNG